MVVLIVCALLLVALALALVIGLSTATDELAPEPVRVRYDQIRRR